MIQRKKKRKKKINLLVVYVVFTSLFSCKNSKLFYQMNNDSQFIKNDEYKIIDRNYKFNLYTINYENKKINGYIGLVNDTIYLVNPMLSDENCYVKSPLLILNQNKSYGVEAISNCDEFPFMGELYSIESTKQEDGYFKIKHTSVETHKTLNDSCTFELSLKKGIRNFKYYHFDSNFKISWTLGRKISE